METTNDKFNRNTRQQNFNQVRGVVSEINPGETFCNITLDLGHEKIRKANFVCRRVEFDNYNAQMGERVSVTFFITSHKKGDEWRTTATILDLIKTTVPS